MRRSPSSVLKKCHLHRFSTYAPSTFDVQAKVARRRLGEIEKMIVQQEHDSDSDEENKVYRLQSIAVCFLF